MARFHIMATYHARHRIAAQAIKDGAGLVVTWDSRQAAQAKADQLATRSVYGRGYTKTSYRVVAGSGHAHKCRCAGCAAERAVL